ncbi:MAG: hypothetical protein JO222_06990, partial [Frankiales bacterium]|nr:hypothetical protein [Frankiales bacterium]
MTTAVAGFLAVPVVGVPVAQAHPVRATVVSLPTRTPTRHGPATVLTRVHTRAFSLVGATWRRGTLDPGTTRLQVRVHQHGHWSGWQDLGAEDGGADGGTPDGRRAAATVGANRVASPLWVGPSDGVEARVVGPPATHAPQALPSAPAALRVVLVDGGSSAADADPRPVTVTGGSVAAAAESQPTIFTRSDWGADESLRRHACPAGPDYAPGIVMGFIHHTDNANGYSRAAVPGIIRSIYAYHVNSNGWCDVGY